MIGHRDKLVRDLLRVAASMEKKGGFPLSAPLMREAAGEIIAYRRTIEGLRARLREQKEQP